MNNNTAENFKNDVAVTAIRGSKDKDAIVTIRPIGLIGSVPIELNEPLGDLHHDLILEMNQLPLKNCFAIHAQGHHR